MCAYSLFNFIENPYTTDFSTLKEKPHRYKKYKDYYKNLLAYDKLYG